MSEQNEGAGQAPKKKRASRAKPKPTIAQAVLHMPAQMAEAAFNTLTPEQRGAITPKQASSILQILTSATHGIAHILSNPEARIVPMGDGKVGVADTPNADKPGDDAQSNAQRRGPLNG